MQRMASSDTLPAQESNSGGGDYSEEAWYGIGHDGREERRASGGVRRYRPEMLMPQIPPSFIYLLRRKRDAVLKVFITVDKAFDDKNLGEGFSSSDEAIAARNIVDNAFDNLCMSNGALAAASGGI